MLCVPSMLLQIGQRRAPQGLVDLLLECHVRIRRFLGSAQRLATTAGLGGDELRTAAAEIRRYFVLSFPLHLADEDETIAPRLAGTSVDVDTALVQMSGDHVAHAALVGSLIDLCAAIERDPGQRDALCARLAQVAATLTAELEPHLELEERVIFRALAALAAPEQDSLHLAMRARRERAMAAP